MTEVYLRYERVDAWWVCTFSIPSELSRPFRILRFSDKEKVRQLVDRAGGLSTLEKQNLLELGLIAGRGGMMVRLSSHQMSKLKG